MLMKEIYLLVCHRIKKSRETISKIIVKSNYPFTFVKRVKHDVMDNGLTLFFAP